jgi:hypothetical protein
VLLVLCLIIFFCSIPEHPAQAKNFTDSPIGFFTENRGQWDLSVLFMGNSSTGKIAITKNYFGTNVDIIGAELLPHYNNYLIGNDPSKWGIHCRNFSRILCKDASNGAEFAYYLTESGLTCVQTQDDSLLFSTYLGGTGKDYASSIAVDVLGNSYVAGWTFSSNFPTTPGIDPDFNYYNDAYLVKLDPAGRLLYSTFLGGWYEDFATSVALDSAGNIYLAGETRSFDFPITTGYDRNINGVENDAFAIKLNKDGTEILYSTYLGGTKQDCASSIAVDKEGNAFIAGCTESVDFPMTESHGGSTNAPGYCQKSNHYTDSFVVKLNTAGTELLYATFLGGNGITATSLVLDSIANAYVAGYTMNPEFPITKEYDSHEKVSGYDQKYNGMVDAFVMKLSATGTELLYSTYLGGGSNDTATSLAVDNNGCVYVTGTTFSSIFPMTKIHDGTEKTSGYDQVGGINQNAFVAKLDSTGSQLLYSTYLAGSEDDGASSLVVDTLGNAYVTGTTESPDFPTTPGFDQTYNGSGDAFVVKLDPTGTELLYSSFLGGKNKDQGCSVAVDPSGKVYIAGNTKSTDFPTTEDAFAQTNSGNFDIFVSAYK